ncbi:hypothetical protein KPL35_06450 [Clostridium sp. CF011]|uniref:hypothetical protein n=1 Tax=Clostridium sp. CF011 TaxID=2843318 RepID=UPI001C0A9D41|nr:hypothetical protein [Clostridium sp. CF011]MBU3091715.1 hypothetical protein [Clostridium sp. CF011]WAG69425.1 hypothetical protein LL036_15715 [Clostridium sp. CF011]
MILREDERVQNSKRIAVRYTYLFEILGISVLCILSIMYKNLILMPPLYLFNSSIYVSISLDPLIAFIVNTQILFMFAAQAIFNKRFGGKRESLISGTAGFRFMDERERKVSDKAISVTFLYINIFLIIWAVIDIFISGKLGLPLIIIGVVFIIYNIAKGIILHNFKEKYHEK